ncbi:hypothetical protein EBU71_12400 [bacterium]|nr:hypothetical protein [Candidatus Elulimicrobium humile]
MTIELIELDFVKAVEQGILLFKYKVEFLDKSKEERHIRVWIKDPYFNSDFMMSPEFITVRDGWTYWTEFNINGAPDRLLGFEGGFQIFIQDVENEELIFHHNWINGTTRWDRREVSEQFPWSSPRAWIVGDSHAWYNFGRTEKKINDLSGYKLIRHSHFGISSHTFWGGKFMEYLKLIPIEQSDAIVFVLGSYDLRKGILKHSQKMGIPPIENLYSMLFQTFYQLKNLRKFYPKNPFIICSAVPPIRKTHIKGWTSTEFFMPGDDEIQRFQLWKTYREFWKRQSKQLEGVHFLDWAGLYVDGQGFCREEFLVPNDIHISNPTGAISHLEKLLGDLKKQASSEK